MSTRQAGPAAGDLSLQKKAVLLFSSVETAIVLGALFVALTYTSVSPDIDVPGWLGRWLSYIAISSVVGIPAAAILNVLAQLVTKKLRVNLFGQIAIYGGLGLLSGVFVLVYGALFLPSDPIIGIAILVSICGMWIGVLGRIFWEVFLRFRTIGYLAAVVDAFLLLAAIIAFLSSQ
ncbi:hypothetical protein AB4Y63_17720 [Leifsonia sp. YAF41]|uniref:hypothetical protein n=1 Tax=Leifsonia sp. YAF41 TaxID=3233086 RepID=UPI003F988110